MGIVINRLRHNLQHYMKPKYIVIDSISNQLFYGHLDRIGLQGSLEIPSKQMFDYTVGWNYYYFNKHLEFFKCFGLTVTNLFFLLIKI